MPLKNGIFPKFLFLTIFKLIRQALRTYHTICRISQKPYPV